MGKHFALTLQVPQYAAERENRQANRQAAASTGFNLKPWQGVVLALVLVAVGMYYVVSANSTATAGYTINHSQTEISDSMQQQKQLETQLAELQSIQTIQSNPAVTQMIPVGAVNYLQASPQLSAR